MFWRNSKAIKISKEDQEFVDENFSSISSLFGLTVFTCYPQVLPTKDFFNWDFKGKDEDAKYVFDQVSSYLNIDNSEILFGIYENPGKSFQVDGMIVSQDIGEDTSVGTYTEYDNGDTEILIEEDELKNPVSLIATIVHELMHFKLRKEVSFQEIDEFLTDIMTIAFGFGIFTANSSISKMNTWGNNEGAGWEITNAKGYIHYTINAYALARYSKLCCDIEIPSWSNYLDKEIKKEFIKCWRYLDETEKE